MFENRLEDISFPRPNDISRSRYYFCFTSLRFNIAPFLLSWHMEATSSSSHPSFAIATMCVYKFVSHGTHSSNCYVRESRRMYLRVPANRVVRKYKRIF